MKLNALILNFMILSAGWAEENKKATTIAKNGKHKETFVEESTHARLTYTFDPAVISRADLKRALEFRGTCPSRLAIETCDKDNKVYKKPCGKANFVANAEINMRLFQEEKTQYEAVAGTLPPELMPVAVSCQTEMTFYVEMGNRLFKFYQTRDIRLLKEKVLSFDPQVIAPKETAMVASEGDADKQYELVKYEWFNKMNHAFRKEFEKLKDISDVWDEFFKIKGIKINTKCLADCGG